MATPAMPTSPAHARMVAVVAAVRGEVEGDREALLPGREVAAIEGVGLLGRGEAGVLPDRPGLGDVHGGVRPAQERRQARHGVEDGRARARSSRGVQRLDREPSGVSQMNSSGDLPVSARKYSAQAS